MQDQTGKIYDDDKAILLGENWSIFFGLPMSSSGHGIRDNAGVIEVKNRGGAWSSPISESALQLGTISNSLSLLTLQVGTISGTVGLQGLQIGTISGTVGLNTLAIGTISSSLGLTNLAVGTLSTSVTNLSTPLSSTFHATGFTGAGDMTWTVDAASMKTYLFLSQNACPLLVIALLVKGSSVGGTVSNTLMFSTPNSEAASKDVTLPCYLSDAGTIVPGIVAAKDGNSTITITKADGTAFTTSDSLTDVGVQMWFPVATI